MDTTGRSLTYAYLREDGSVWYVDCPECHFYKNSPRDVGKPCRSSLCETGVVEIREAVAVAHLAAEAEELQAIAERIED